MGASKGDGKKPNLIVKTWQMCKGGGGGGDGEGGSRRRVVAPQGCFYVYVGPKKQRFVVRTEYAKHPLFQNLLDEAESEFGYNSEGPLVLPCDINSFKSVLMAMVGGDGRLGFVHGGGGGDGFPVQFAPRIA